MTLLHSQGSAASLFTWGGLVYNFIMWNFRGILCTKKRRIRQKKKKKKALCFSCFPIRSLASDLSKFRVCVCLMDINCAKFYCNRLSVCVLWCVQFLPFSLDCDVAINTVWTTVYNVINYEPAHLDCRWQTLRCIGDWRNRWSDHS